MCNIDINYTILLNHHSEVKKIIFNRQAIRLQKEMGAIVMSYAKSAALQMPSLYDM